VLVGGEWVDWEDIQPLLHQGARPSTITIIKGCGARNGSKEEEVVEGFFLIDF